MSKPDWAAIEADYLATGITQEDLARKWNVPYSTVKKRAMRGKWGDKRMNVAQAIDPNGTGRNAALVAVERGTKKERGGKMERETVVEQIAPEDYAIELRAKRAQKMIEATDAMMDRIITALETTDNMTPFAIKTLASALRDLREMQGLNKSALDIEEQRARIAKLRSETQREEIEAHEPLTIEFVNIEGAEI